MSMRPTGLIVEPSGGVYAVIDDPDAASVLLIPCSFNHRRVVSRDELASLGEFHPTQAAPSPLPVREEWRVVDKDGNPAPTNARPVLAGGDLGVWDEFAPDRAPHRLERRSASEWVDVPAPAEDATSDGE